MKRIGLSLLTISASVLCSCHSGGIADGSPVRLVRPSGYAQADADTSISRAFRDVVEPVSLQIVNDSMLVIQDRVADNNIFHFKCYTLPDLSFLGSFIRQGRGPGEMLSPHLERTDPGAKRLRLTENSSGTAYEIDVATAIATQDSSGVRRIKLPEGVFSHVLLPDSQLAVLQLKDNELLFRILAKDGEELKTYRPYKDIDGGRCMTYLSGILLHNAQSSQLAEVMLFFPQVNLIDYRTDKRTSIAVGGEYRKWMSVIAQMMDLGSVQYYSSATATTEYIFAVYDKVSLGGMIAGEYLSSVHIFDWRGNFLRELALSGRVSDVAFDSRTRQLYCIDKEESRIVRYSIGEK